VRTAALVLAFVLAAPAPAAASEWPQWRGPLGTGTAPAGADPPIEWSETSGVRWKAALPGLGHSSPIVWGDRVFLTTAVPRGEPLAAAHADADGAHDNVPAAHVLDFVVLAIDRRDGSIAWRTTVRTERPHEGAHETAGWASASPVTDGEHVIASFGSRGLYALDMAGAVVWEKDLGDMQIYHGHGEGSSPALHAGIVVVNWDHQGQSFLAAFDKRTGAERWRAAREEITSWSSPIVVEHAGRAQVVTSATHRVRGQALADGAPLWEVGGLSTNVVATPVAGAGLVFAGSSYDTRKLLAIRLDAARGDITGTSAVAWSRDRDTPYVPSPVLDGGTLCFVKHIQAFLTCLDAATGAPAPGLRRLEKLTTIYASPVAAAGRIYVVDRSGTTAVLDRARDLAPLATNLLADSFSASPAIAGDELYLRGDRNLYCLARKSPTAGGGNPPGGARLR
jgi:outer membrane protein assembly factor BamB